MKVFLVRSDLDVKLNRVCWTEHSANAWAADCHGYVSEIEIEPLFFPLAQYFEFRGYKFPNTEQAMLFLTSEIGELADELVHAQSPDWVRNNPEDKGKGVANEGGDVLMMLIALLSTLQVCPIEAMFDKWAEKGFDQKSASRRE